MINEQGKAQEINVSVPKIHRFRCIRGHEWEAEHPFKILFSRQMPDSPQFVKSHECCIECLFEDFAKRYPPPKDLGEVVEEEQKGREEI